MTADGRDWVITDREDRETLETKREGVIQNRNEHLRLEGSVNSNGIMKWVERHGSAALGWSNCPPEAWPNGWLDTESSSSLKMSPSREKLFKQTHGRPGFLYVSRVGKVASLAKCQRGLGQRTRCHSKYCKSQAATGCDTTSVYVSKFSSSLFTLSGPRIPVSELLETVSEEQYLILSPVFIPYKV